MIDAVQEYNGDLYVPAESFFDILRKVAIPGLRYDKRKEALEFDVIRYNVRSLDIEEKSNGTIIRINTQESFSDRDISSFINKHGWFYLTIVGGIVDTSSNGDDGTANTGNGGNGATTLNSDIKTGGKGGSGVVILKYLI